MSTNVLGLGRFLPPEEVVDGARRPLARAPGGPSDLVLEPARQALRAAECTVEDLDLLVFATMTPDVTFPGAACYLQKKLECPTVGALDLRGQCTGFLIGLSVADAFLSTGTYRTVLLAAAEVHSAGLDYSPRGMAVARLYGDGAAAVVLGAEGAGGRDVVATLASVVCHADGRRYDRFWCEYPSSRHHPLRITVEALEAGRHYPEIDFESVREFGSEKLPAAVGEALAAAAIGPAEVDCFILSHILPEVVEASARSLAVPAARVLDAGRLHGHLSAATLPVALDEALASGRIGKGARVCLAACGAGFTWGAAVLSL